ncbi:MAG: ABC transporter permease [Eubacterium sp.]|nr:ABC transporter permease [Eubacterium sp.]
MAKYIGKRFVQMILILLAASVLIFCMVRIAPSDPIASMTKGKKISDETRQALTQQYHLDKSLPEQYVIWITGVLHGDFGDSFDYKRPVSSLIAERIPTTLQIVLMSAILALLIAIPIGIICAVKMNTWLDRLLSILTLIFVASPVFLTAIILMIVFALKLKIFPTFGAGKTFVENLYYLFLPSLALSMNMVALIARITRSNMIEQLNSNYATTAVAKGIPYRTIVLKHCLKNAVIPVITVASIQVGSMIIGAVLVENVFALGGIGDILISSIKSSDYPVVQSITLLMVALFVIINLIVDIVYALIDPRIRLE